MSDPINYQELEDAYRAAKFGELEPTCMIMGDAGALRLYKQANPAYYGTDAQALIALPQAYPNIVQLEDGLWMWCADSKVVDKVRAR